MSDRRLVWTDLENTRLIRTRHELPKATVQELTDVFNQSNGRKRSSIAVRTKLRNLGLSTKPRSNIIFPTMPAPLRGLSLRNRPRVNVGVSMEPAKSPEELQRTCKRPPARYDLGVPELGILLPLHPLIAEARQYAASPQTPGHCGDLCLALPWPSTLGKDSVSKLKCTEKDKRVLQMYMDYLGSWRPSSQNSNTLGLLLDRGDAGSQDAQHTGR